MHLSPPKAVLVAFAAIGLVSAGCAGSSTPTVAPYGATGTGTTTSETDTANNYLNEIESPSPSPTAITTQPTTGSGTDVDFGELNALAVASVPGSWEYPLAGQCILTAPPAPTGSPAPSASAEPSPSMSAAGTVANPLAGTTIDVVLSDLSGYTTSGTGAGTGSVPSPSASPSATMATTTTTSPAPSTGASPSSSPAVAPISNVYLSLTLQQTAATSQMSGTSTTASPSATMAPASPSASPSTTSAAALAPFIVGGPDDTVSTARIQLPNQDITNGTLLGGAVASNARSGYVAFDANGQTVYVNFLCLNVSSFVNVTGPSASPSTPPATKEPKKTP